MLNTLDFSQTVDYHYDRFPPKTAITHLEFEALHPFQDGNGRIGRADYINAMAGRGN